VKPSYVYSILKPQGQSSKSTVRPLLRKAKSSYVYSILKLHCQSSITSPEVEGKIPADDKKKLEDAIEETLQWLDSNLSAEKEEFEEKQKSLEGIAMPILQSMAGAAGGAPGGMPGGMPGAGGMPDFSAGGGAGAPPADDPASGPTIEEID